MSQIGADRYANVEEARADTAPLPLRRRRPRTEPAGDPEPRVRVARPEQETATAEPARPKRTATSKAKKTQPAGEIVPTAVHIPGPLLEKVVARRESTGLSNGGVVIQAVEAVHKKLGKLIEPDPVAGGGIFEPVAARPRQSPVPLSPLNIRLTRRNVEALDGLAAKHGVSRSRLVTVALEAFFGH